MTFLVSSYVLLLTANLNRNLYNGNEIRPYHVDQMNWPVLLFFVTIKVLCMHRYIIAAIVFNMLWYDTE